MQPTPRTKLRPTLSEFTCKETKDAEDNPVVLKMRRLTRLVLLPIMRANPYVVPGLTDEQRKDAEERLKLLSQEEREKRATAYQEMADRIVCLACVEPLLTCGEENENEASITVINEEERMAAMEHVLTESGYLTAEDKEVDDLTRFPAGRKGRRRSSAATSEAGGTSTPPVEAAGD